MTLQEAIEIKREYRREHYHGFNRRVRQADDLSIEALKEVERLRVRRIINFDNQLPGETIQ